MFSTSFNGASGQTTLTSNILHLNPLHFTAVFHPYPQRFNSTFSIPEENILHRIIIKAFTHLYTE